MAKERELRVKLLGDASGAKKAFRELDDAADKSEGRIKKAGGAISGLFGAAIAGGIGAAGKALFDLGSKLESTAQKARIVFGTEAIGQVEQWADANANAMGLTSREAVGLATNLADLLIPMGFARDEAARMSTQIVGLSGALSAWSNGTRSASEVAEILTAALLGERDSLKGLGISISQAEVDQRVFNKGMKDAVGPAKQQAEALATVELILEKSTDAQKAFGDETVTTAEKTAQARAKFNELKEDLAVFTQEITTRYTPGVLEFGESYVGLQGQARKLGEELVDLVAGMESFHEQAIRGQKEGNALAEVWKALYDIGGHLSDLLYELGKGGTTDTTPPPGVSSGAPSSPGIPAPAPGTAEGGAAFYANPTPNVTSPTQPGPAPEERVGVRAASVTFTGDIVMSAAMSPNQFLQQLADTVAIATRMG